jgi:hypothetical protein
MDLEMTGQEIGNSLYDNNTVKTSRYPNIDDLRTKIENWENDL